MIYVNLEIPSDFDFDLHWFTLIIVKPKKLDRGSVSDSLNDFELGCAFSNVNIGFTIIKNP